MIADPDSLRSEPFVQVGALLQRGAAAILDRWCQRAAREQPHAHRVHQDTLRDHLSELLDAIGRSLAAAGACNGHQHAPPAADHGDQRWIAGWSLAEVVRDYQILRQVVLEYLDGELNRPLTLRENLAIGLVLDEAISASVERYTRHLEDEAVRRKT